MSSGNRRLILLHLLYLTHLTCLKKIKCWYAKDIFKMLWGLADLKTVTYLQGLPEVLQIFGG